MDIHIIDLSHQRNDEHYEFGREFGEQVVTADPAELKIEPLYSEWRLQFSLEDEALKKIPKSAFTDLIIEADRMRDRNFRGIAGLNRALQNHYDPAVAEAAGELQIIFSSYGNIAGRGLAEKAGAYDNLIQELKSEQHAEAVEIVSIGEWIDRLAADNAEVFRIMQQRYDESAGKTNIVMKDAREKVDAAYRAICKRISALLEVLGDSEEGEIYRKFVRRLNVIIDRYNNIMASRRGRSGNSTADEAPADAAE